MAYGRKEGTNGKGRNVEKGKEKKEENRQEEYLPRYRKVIEYKLDGKHSYVEFLHVFRNSVINGIVFGINITFCKPKFEGNIPVIDIELDNGVDKIIVRIVCHTVYVAGYKSFYHNQWYRFNEKEYKFLFPAGTDILPFGGSYAGLGTLLGTTFGFGTLSAAISGLNQGVGGDTNRKLNIRMLCLMISEAARFNIIANGVIRSVNNNSYEKIKEKYCTIITNWSSSCKTFIKQALIAIQDVQLMRLELLKEADPVEIDSIYPTWSQKEIIKERDPSENENENDYTDEFEKDSHQFTRVDGTWGGVKKEDGTIMNQSEIREKLVAWLKTYYIMLIGSAFKKEAEAEAEKEKAKT